MTFKRLAAGLLAGLLLWLASPLAAQTPAAAEDAAAPDDPGSVLPRQMDMLDDERTLEVGDRLLYQVIEEQEPPVVLFVNGRGDLKVPLLGPTPAVGHTPQALAYAIKEELEETFFHQATVVLDVRESDQYRGRVFLLGEVRSKGSVPLPADEVVTLSDIILRSGGFTELADTSGVTLIRRVPAESGSGLTEESREEYDVGQMLETGNFEDDPALVEDDLVLVPKSEEVGGEVYVLEAVNRPGALPVPSEDFTMSQAILAAGGFTRFARGNRVRLVRYNDETGEKETTYHDIEQVFEEGDRSDDPVVAPGDFIIVEERTFNFGG